MRPQATRLKKITINVFYHPKNVSTLKSCYFDSNCKNLEILLHKANQWTFLSQNRMNTFMEIKIKIKISAQGFWLTEISSKLAYLSTADFSFFPQLIITSHTMKAIILFFALIALLDLSQGQDSVALKKPGKIKIIIDCIIFNSYHNCLPKSAICFLPEKTNTRGRSCKAFIPLYRYDYKSKLCVKFVYGGCDGTANQFPTLMECIEFCGAENGFITPGNILDFYGIKEDLNGQLIA